MDNKLNVNVLKHNSYNSDHYCNTVIKWKPKIKKMDNKIDVNVIKDNSYNSDH